MNCKVRDCANAGTRRGWCDRHYRRWLRNGDPEADAPMGCPRGDTPTYNAVHLRLKRARGEARLLDCVDCGCPARTWSYDRSDPNQVWDSHGRPYSYDLFRYHPRCSSCHSRMDWRLSRAEKSA